MMSRNGLSGKLAVFLVLGAFILCGFMGGIGTPAAYAVTSENQCTVTINQDLSFTLSNGVYDAGPLIGQMELEIDFQYFGEKNGQLLWRLSNVDASPPSSSCSVSIASDLSFTLTDALYDAGPLVGQVALQVGFEYFGEHNGGLLWRLADAAKDSQPEPSQDDCGAYVAPGVWKAFDCYNLAAVGRTTSDDPFSPSWRLTGGYWQWGRKGPDSSQWYDTNTEHFAHGPTGSGISKANAGTISGWDGSDAPDGAWSDSQKTTNDPCPDGFRIPSISQWEGVMDNNSQSAVGTWNESDTHYAGARFFGDGLMLPAAGYRRTKSGPLYRRGYTGKYWSSTENSSAAWFLAVFSGYADTSTSGTRRNGYSVRCIADDATSQTTALAVDTTSVSLESGSSETVSVSGGSGYYSASVDEGQVAAITLNGGILEITGLSAGSAVITVEDSSGATVSVSVTVTSSYAATGECGAFVAPGVWKRFDCYNLAAVGKTTGDDPFTPSWRLIGGYWQWGRKGPDSSQWHDTNTEDFAHGPTGSGNGANAGTISGWVGTNPPDNEWLDSHKTASDPCPDGFRIPSISQWEGVIDNNIQSAVGTWDEGDTHYASARFLGNDLMLPATGYRRAGYGSLYRRGYTGKYWSSSTDSGNKVLFMTVFSGFADTSNKGTRQNGYSVRCVAE